MATVAGVNFPCFDCKLVERVCRKRDEIMRDVFFAIGNGKKVECSSHEESNYHGLEGVRP